MGKVRIRQLIRRSERWIRRWFRKHNTAKLRASPCLRSDLVDPSVDLSVGKLGWSVGEDAPADVSIGKVGPSVAKDSTRQVRTPFYSAMSSIRCG